MVLNAESPVPLAFYAFHRAVQQIAMCHCKLRGFQAFLIYRIGMVLRGDLDLSGFQILYRMVASPMPEFEFIGLGAVSEGQDLMPKTDAEYRVSTEQRFYGNRRLGYVRRIARPV